MEVFARVVRGEVVCDTPLRIVKYGYCDTIRVCSNLHFVAEVVKTFESSGNRNS